MSRTTLGAAMHNGAMARAGAPEAEILVRPPPPADARIAYAPEPSHFDELRLPTTAGPRAVAVVLHGGRRAAELNLGGGAVQDFPGGEPREVPERYAAASPIEHLPLAVPCVLVHGTEDANVPFEQSERYASLARARGDDAQLKPIPGAGHFQPIDPLSEAWPVVLSAVRCLL